MVWNPKDYISKNGTPVGKDRKPWFPELNEIRETRMSLYVVLIGTAISMYLFLTYHPLAAWLLIVSWGYYVSVLVSVRLKWHHVKLMEEIKEVRNDIINRNVELAQEKIPWMQMEE